MTGGIGNLTGRAHSKMTTPLESPSLRMKRGLNSPAIPGGLSLNAPENHPAFTGEARENCGINRFGSGMGAALIGNNNRLKGSKFIMTSTSPRQELGTIGWGSSNPKLEQGIQRRILPDMSHK